MEGALGLSLVLKEAYIILNLVELVNIAAGSGGCTGCLVGREEG